MNRLGSSGGQSSLPTLVGCLDDNDNHSSEEELEDIIGSGGKKAVYGVSSIKTGSSSSSTNTEKRKWSEVNSSSGDEAGRTSQCVFRAGSGSSGDEEVSGLMLAGGTQGGSSYTPVQFCTSPPLDVYKPRKSQSPPPKLFHMAAQSGPARQHSLDCGRGREGQRPSGAFLPRRLLRPVEYSSLPARQDSGDLRGGQEEAEPGEEAGHRSPNKRHRSTPKPHNIQRPCLDFEKMQQVIFPSHPVGPEICIKLIFQIKTKVVTSWRQGTELSLFCW